MACDQVPAPALRTLLAANQDRISLPTGLSPDDIDQATKDAKQHGGFVPLADVADIIWTNLPSQVRGGRDTPRIGSGHSHDADIDQPRSADHLTLRDPCRQDPAKVAVPIWQAFYDALGQHAPRDRGLLPFRVWQFYDAMLDALSHDDLTRYLAAAGLLAHYIGDACQPLHGSVLADGLLDGTGKGVHSAYESAMIGHHATDILAALPDRLHDLAAHPLPSVTSGQQAAATVALMNRTATAIPPAVLVTAYAATPGGQSQAVTSKLWNQFGPATITVLADGTGTLAMLWDNAWAQGHGPTRFAPTQLIPIGRTDLQTLYENPAVESTGVVYDLRPT